jgi:DNA-binding LytR/AlgR family response regulator
MRKISEASLFIDICKEKRMIRAAFCDDDPAVLEKLCSLVEAYRVEQNQAIEYAPFRSPLELVAAVEKGCHYDVILLDVLMPGENGIEAAREIREKDREAKIIFLTSSAEFAVQSYTVDAFYYQLKPIWRESFFRLMTQVISEIGKEQESCLILRCKTGIARIPIGRLEYTEVIRRSLFLHLVGGRELECAVKIDDMEARLAPFGAFIRPHRSFLVNMDCIQNISARCITLASHTEVPIPHGKYTAVKDRYLEYLFEHEQAVL